MLVSAIGSVQPVLAEQLMASPSPDRSNPVLLSGAQLSGSIHVFVEPSAPVTQVQFFLDDPAQTNAPFSTEVVVPYDFARTNADNSAIGFDSNSISEGPHNITALISFATGAVETVSADFLINNQADGSDFFIQISNSPDRSNPVTLGSSDLSGDIHVFVEPTLDVAQVRFFLDDPAMSGAPQQTENVAPYDFSGTAAGGLAASFDSNSILDGPHNITASITLVDGSIETLSADFIVANGVNSSIFSIQASPSPNRGNSTLLDGSVQSGDFHAFISPDNGISQVRFFLDDPSMLAAPIQVETVAPFDFAGTAAGGLAAAFDTSTLVDGSHSITVSISRTSGEVDEINAQFVTANGSCAPISTVSCEAIRIVGGRVLEFNENAGGLPDRNGVGTGFTMVDPPSNPGNPVPSNDAPGLIRDNLLVDINAGTLNLTTNPGIQFGLANSQDNALGVGINVPSAQVTLNTSLVELPPAPGGFAQAGLWYGSADNFGLGTAEDDYIKLVVFSNAQGTYNVQALMELDGATIANQTAGLPATVSSIDFRLVANPINRTVTAFFNIGEGEVLLNVFTDVPSEWFSFDQAGIEPRLGTRSHGGIFATNRNAPNSLTFKFSQFSLSEQPLANATGDLEFDRWNFAVPSAPTAMAFGPDNRLYVATIFGTIFAYTLDTASQTVIDQLTINTITQNNGGNRLTLGIAIDPASTPDNVILWASHSSGSTNNGVENSGTVSRLSGPNLINIDNVITGLPRAIANHAINGIEFGPDGRLYIAFGGNTGAGAANSAPTEFGPRPEQPLSAAILVADVKSPGFLGSCATPVGQFGIPASCSVEVFASGLRNSYDLEWHSNGSLYATDNGLGVTGTYPPTPNPDCTAFGDVGLHNPGVQPDLLYRVLQGRYYGHPNPYRNECVFKDGSLQGVPALPNYEPPLTELGTNRSGNGIIEYRGEGFFSRLMGQLLIANFSVGDDITRTLLNDAGDEAIETVSIVSGGLNNPLPLTQDPSGNIFVGEQGSQEVTVLSPAPLVPEPVGNWNSRAAVPVAVLDADGTNVGNRLFMVGGETSAQHVSTLRIYDPVNDSWSTGPNLPGVAVEDPATVEFDGMFFVFGGSTASFSGAVDNAARFDPDTGDWLSLASMNIARAGATAEVINGRIYVVGGLSAGGTSLASVEIYDPATNSWTFGPNLQTPRDNTGSAAFGNRLYVFGGRNRGSNENLNSIEIFDASTNTWAFGAPMPTGRRSMVVGTISDRAQVIGGENPARNSNEEYDPSTDSWRTLTPITTQRHGAVAATIRGRIYVVGGGPSAGSTFTNVQEVFAY